LAMLDLVFLALGAACFILGVAYALACQQL
jgi:1,4-dihydroxy-2-naphthoate octaprenyltransferase